MTRNCFALLLLACLVGCGWTSNPTLVYQIKTNDYEVEFDGLQKRATIGEGHLAIVRVSEDIRIAEGRLSVGKRDYGAVRLKDKISVVGGKVSVNGRIRLPLGS